MLDLKLVTIKALINRKEAIDKLVVFEKGINQ